MRRKFMSMALTAAMVLSMAATPVFAGYGVSDRKDSTQTQSYI